MQLSQSNEFLIKMVRWTFLRERFWTRLSVQKSQKKSTDTFKKGRYFMPENTEPV